MTSQIVKSDETTTTLKASGSIDGNTAVSGRLVLERFSLSERYDAVASDNYTLRKMRNEFDQLYRPMISKNN